jgi:hypothetical protein
MTGKDLPNFIDANPNKLYAILITKYVGSYNFGGLGISLTKRPSRWHQFWMRVCLGWIWKDY